jgi:hypothetical protein
MKKVFNAEKVAKLPAIQNKVLDAPTVPWAELQQYEANRLKPAEKRNVSKLKSAILDQGFSFPLIVWAPKGRGIAPLRHRRAGRMAALKALEKDGHPIPPIPVVLMEAATKAEAKKLVAMASSQFGVADAQSFEAFVQDIGGLQAINALVSINSITFATDYVGRVVGADDKEGGKKRVKFAAKDFEPPEFEPGDVFIFDNHELMAGHENVPILAKLLRFIRKEWPDLELQKNGVPL